jgi:LysR family transcriptional regulator, glycine cleavage system transcriptional activator
MLINNVPLPSFDSLVAFESAARHESFTRAAAELNVTQGAISRQIRVLEERLGVLLFERVRRRVVLAEAGRAYLLDVRRVLNHLESATERLMTAADRTNLLHLAVLPAIATHWLIPRLPDYVSKHPGVSISCTIRQAPFDFATEPFDAAFHLGSPTWAGAVAYRLMGECLVPVSSPAFRSAHRIHRVDDLARMPLLQVASRPAGWAAWFERAKLPTTNACQGLTFDNFAMLTSAAIAGLGVALLPTFFVAAELRERKLVALAPPQPSTHAYYLVVPEAKTASPHIMTFVRWITEAEQARPAEAAAGRVSEREHIRRVAS